MSKAIMLAAFFVLVVDCSCHVYAAQITPMAFYDAWTYVKTLEDRKAYSSLAASLEPLLEQRTTDKGQASTTNMDQKIYDPEGVAYLLDDLAEVYMRGLVDFQKALSYNKRAADLYVKILSGGLDKVPLSDYYNPRRMLYYYIYPLADEAGSKDARAIKENGPEKLFNERLDVATLFPKAILDTVRTNDLKALRERVDRRQAYLSQKLGISSGEMNKAEMESGLDELALIKELLRNFKIYNTYYKNAFLAGKMWFIHRQGGNVDYREFAALCKEALESEKGQRLKGDLDSYNFLFYWLGISYLKLGELKEGTYHLKRFFKGLDEADDLDEYLAKKRKKVMGKAVEEKERAWETFAIVLNVVGVVAGVAISVAGQAAAQQVASAYSQGTYHSVQQVVAAQQAAQEAIKGIAQQMLITSAAVSLGSQAASRLSAEKVNLETQDTKKLAGLVTSLALKASRYLDKFDQVELYAELGRAYEKLGQNGKAIRFYGEALSIIEAQRSTISSENQRISFSAIKDDLYKGIIPLLIKEGQLEKAFEYVERAKARAFLDVLAGKKEIVFKNTGDTEAFRSFMRGKDEISSLLEQTGLGFEQVASVGTRLNREHGGARTDNKTAEIESLTEVKTITAQEAIFLTKSEISIVEYFIAGNRLYIFLLDDGQLTVKEKEIETKAFFGLINALREGITTPKRASEGMESAARDLYNLLFRPVLGQISKKRIYIVPSGWLYYLPFQVLQGDTRYLVEDFAITYAPSTTVLKYSLEKGRENKKDSVLVLANADVGDDRYNLPFAEEEGSFIANSFKDSKLFMRKDATKGRFVEYAPRYDVIHIASHAFFDSQDPLRSSIQLASSGTDDGRLETTELYQMNLKASLVVLSACQTGLAYVVQGDELIGLIRGVMYSGANSVLSTLWSVDDKSTTHLMKFFYESYKTMPKDLALQRAQLATMKAFPDPYNWAPFVLTGSHN